MKIRSVRTELLHKAGRTDGRTDMTKLVVAFRSLANAAKSDAGTNSDILHDLCLESCKITGMGRNKHKVCQE